MSYPDATSIIRIEVEGIRHTLIRHLQTYSRTLENEVDKAVREYPWEEAIRSRVRQQIPGLIDRAISEAINDLRYEIGGRLKEPVLAAVRKAFDNPQENP